MDSSVKLAIIHARNTARDVADGPMREALLALVDAVETVARGREDDSKRWI